MSINKPKYPIYIPSKDRASSALTVKFFIKWNVDFYLVVEPKQKEKYKEFKKYLLILPNDKMRLLGARLWIRKHAIKNGYDRHWQFDDNIRSIRRLHKGIRIRCNPNTAIRIIEDFTDRYTNIAISGFDYEMFVVDTVKKPFVVNVHIYSASLINNNMPYKWRLFYNDDTDLCLQVLDGGLCTVQFKTLMSEKARTMTVAGGNTKDLYQKDGRLKMARTLEEIWPQYVETKWRYGRPQHVIKNNWKQFKTKLIRRSDINWNEIKNQKYNFTLKPIKKDIKCKFVNKLLKDEI